MYKAEGFEYWGHEVQKGDVYARVWHQPHTGAKLSLQSAMAVMACSTGPDSEKRKQRATKQAISGLPRGAYAEDVK